MFRLPRRRSHLARWATAASFLAILSAASCGGGDRGEPVVRLVDLAPGGTYARTDGTVEAVAAEPILTSAAADPAGWRSLDFSRLERGSGAADAPGAPAKDSATVLSGGALELKGETGVWVYVVPVEPGEVYALEGEVHVREPVPSQGRARANIGLVELDEAPDFDELGRVLEHIVAQRWADGHWGEDDLARLGVLSRVSARTRYLGVACALELQHPSAQTRVTFDRLRLAPANEADLLAEVCGDPAIAERPGVPPVASFSLGMVHRPSLVLLPGGEVRLPVRFPDEGNGRPARFEAFAGIVADGYLEEGREVELVCEGLSKRGSKRFELARATLVGRPVEETRWNAIEAALPSELAGADGELIVRAVAKDAAPCTVALGSARLVPGSPRRAGPNLVLVSLDTLRADHVGCYGYERPTTPHLDALAQEGLLFEDVWASCSYTLPSHMTLFSGQHGSVHGVQSPRRRLDGERTRLLAELLRERGWTTGAFTGGGFLDPEFGFARGFERYSFADPLTNLETSVLRKRFAEVPGLLRALEREGSLDAVDAWLERHRDESFFLFLHTYAAHEFNPGPRELAALGIEGGGLEDDPVSQGLLVSGTGPTPEQRERLIDLYDGGVRQADTAVGRVIAALKRLELWEDTIVLVTSDHGKEIGDHGRIGHGHTLYEELLRIPLVLRVPGMGARRVPEPAMLADVAPTLLSLLDVAPPQGVSGIDLLGPLRERPLFAEVDNLAVKRALREGPIKTIHSPLDADAYFANEVEAECFDLARDPEEREPLAPEPDRVRRLEDLRSGLRAWGRALGSGGAGDAELPADTKAHLRALGYVHDADG